MLEALAVAGIAVTMERLKSVDPEAAAPRTALTGMGLKAKADTLKG